MPLYTFVYNLLNVLVQIAYKMGLQKKISFFTLSYFTYLPSTLYFLLLFLIFLISVLHPFTVLFFCYTLLYFFLLPLLPFLHKFTFNLPLILFPSIHVMLFNSHLLHHHLYSALHPPSVTRYTTRDTNMCTDHRAMGRASKVCLIKTMAGIVFLHVTIRGQFCT
jgi:hypothetical protein